MGWQSHPPGPTIPLPPSRHPRRVMKHSVCASLLWLASTLPALAFPLPVAKPARVPEVTPVHASALAFVALDDRMPRTKLRPAVYVPNLCVYRYRVGTQSADCQRFVD